MDPLPVEPCHPRPLVRDQVLHLLNGYARLGELVLDVVPAPGVAGDQVLDGGRDGLQERVPVYPQVVRAEEGHLGHQPRHAYHEELVHVAAAYGDELHALEDGVAGVLGLLEAAPVELEPGQLPVDEVLLVVEVRLFGHPHSSFLRLILTDSQWANSPSAVERTSIVGAMASRPSCVRYWTVEVFMK